MASWRVTASRVRTDALRASCHPCAVHEPPQDLSELRRAPRRERSIWSLTLVARYVPTSALMALGRIALCERERVPKRVTAASVAYELALTVLASLSLSVYLLWRLPQFDNVLKYVAIALPVL